MNFDSIVLAAGKGTRMKGHLSKVLHPLVGRRLVYFPVCAALEAGADRVVVVCRAEDREALEAYLTEAFGAERVTCVVQADARGTGDAAKVGLLACHSERVLILCGDTPLVTASDLRPLLESGTASLASLVVASCQLEEPRGYGRVLRDADGRVAAIREHRDASESEQGIREVNAGIYFGETANVTRALGELRPNNDQGEYYLTDIVESLAKTGRVCAHLSATDAMMGVNDRVQLAQAERLLFERIRNRHRLAGVTVRGEACIDDTVEIGQDALIEAGVHLRQATKIGAGTTVDAGSVLTNAEVGDYAVVLPYTVITDSSVGQRAQLGPFSHLRPASVIEDEAHIGNFVETKKTRVRRGAKANHLAYLGDGDVGEKANIGAGTIFCNYDGFRKQPTIIGAGAFIGSDSQLVAPVVIGKGAYVATGTTVTKNVPDDGLAISRVRQENKEGYAARLRSRLAAQAGKKA